MKGYSSGMNYIKKNEYELQDIKNEREINRKYNNTKRINITKKILKYIILSCWGFTSIIAICKMCNSIIMTPAHTIDLNAQAIRLKIIRQKELTLKEVKLSKAIEQIEFEKNKALHLAGKGQDSCREEYGCPDEAIINAQGKTKLDKLKKEKGELKKEIAKNE